MKKNKSSKDWINKKNKENFFKKSKIIGYRSRSAFKLLEMEKKFNFFKKNSYVLDLGCCPGGWLQVVTKKVKVGKVLGVDIKNMEEIKNVNFIKGDFLERDTKDKIENYFEKKINIVLSDMATNTTGNKTLDSYRTGELCLNSMDIAVKMLINDGIFLSKVFMGSIFSEIKEKAKKNFKKVVVYKPLSSKKESKEIYIFCKGILKV